jgi:hypothetical protein
MQPTDQADHIGSTGIPEPWRGLRDASEPAAAEVVIAAIPTVCIAHNSRIHRMSRYQLTGA